MIGEVKARLNAIDLDLQGGNRTFLPQRVALHCHELSANVDKLASDVPDISLHLYDIGLHPPQDFQNQVLRLLDHGAP